MKYNKNNHFRHVCTSQINLRKACLPNHSFSQL